MQKYMRLFYARKNMTTKRPWIIFSFRTINSKINSRGGMDISLERKEASTFADLKKQSISVFLAKYYLYIPEIVASQDRPSLEYIFKQETATITPGWQWMVEETDLPIDLWANMF